MANPSHSINATLSDIDAPENTNAYLEQAIALAGQSGAEGKAQSIQQVGIVGAGAMGHGIAVAFLNAGRSVTLFDVSQAALDKAQAIITSYFDRQLQKSRIDREALTRTLSAIKFTQLLGDLSSSDMTIEAVPEKLELKQQVMASLCSVTGPNTILATNTSTLDIDAIASAVDAPERVIGTHFFIPAQITPLLEVIPGKNTSKDVLTSVMSLAGELRKTPVIAGNSDGFVGNRLFDRFHQEAMFMLEEGAFPQQVDQALEQWGYVIGPFRTLDIIGNVIPWSVRVERKMRNPNVIQPTIGDVLCERGYHGPATGNGWYAYEDGSRNPAPSVKANDLILEVSEDLGITRRTFEREEIIARCVLTVINEAAAILRQGLALRGSDIDVVQVNGYGFPAKFGGPLRLADHIGLENIVKLIQHYETIAGDGRPLWKPDPLLIELANSGTKISTWENN